MTWTEVCEDPSLRDTPYRVETNEFGQIIMSPAKRWHSWRESRIITRLDRLMKRGEVLPQPPIRTRSGTKVPDVGWFSNQRLQEVGISNDEAEFMVCCEIVVEVLSESNTSKEMEEKRVLYFEQGALEFWTCDLGGKMRFWNAQSELPLSQMCPKFPLVIKVK